MIQKLLGGLVGNAARNFEQPQGSENGDRDVFTENRFSSWTGDNLVDGQFVEFANYRVPAQTGYVWGYGEPAPGKDQNQGRIYADFQGDTPSGVVGRLRLESSNAVGKNKEDHGTYHTSELSANLSDKRTWQKLPEAPMDIVTEDSYLRAFFEYDAAASTDSTLDQTNSTVRISTTEFTF